MKKRIFIVGSSYESAVHLFHQYLEPFLLYKEISKDTYETEVAQIRLLSIQNVISIRGLDADWVYLDSDIETEQYNNLILPMVKGNHNRVNIF